MTVITARDIRKRYHDIEVLKGVDLSINQGEIVSIVGASGAGKTTLLHILGTLDLPGSGNLEIMGKKMDELKSKERAAFRNKNIGFVFQFHHLLPEFTAVENAAMPLFIAGKSHAQAIETATEYLSFMGMENRLHHKPAQLSGGEQQRVAVARSLVNKPAVVFADEPSGNLDSNSAKALHTLFFTLRAQFNQTFVIVTHNDELAAKADRKLVMQDGKISL